MTPTSKRGPSVNLERVVSSVLAKGAEVMIRENLFNGISGLIQKGVIKVDGESTSMRMWEIQPCVWAFYNSASRDCYLFTSDLERGTVVYQKLK